MFAIIGKYCFLFSLEEKGPASRQSRAEDLHHPYNYEATLIFGHTPALPLNIWASRTHTFILESTCPHASLSPFTHV